MAFSVVLNLFYGWFYTIDFENTYHRGPLFLLSASFSILLLVFASGMVLLNRKRTHDRYYYSLLFFIIPPSVSIVLQIFLYGSSLILNSVVLSILIVFLNIQNESIFTDHLTGVYNRNMLDQYLQTKIEKTTDMKTFSAIMLDLNNFKKINDTYGHDMGDEALCTTVRILKSAIKSNDFIARFDGDEFWLILNTSTDNELLEIAKKININLAKYNELDSKTYDLGFSIGFSVYNYTSKMSAEEFQKYLDNLMYNSKNNRSIL